MVMWSTTIKTAINYNVGIEAINEVGRHTARLVGRGMPTYVYLWFFSLNLIRQLRDIWLPVLDISSNFFFSSFGSAFHREAASRFFSCSFMPSHSSKERKIQVRKTGNRKLVILNYFNHRTFLNFHYVLSWLLVHLWIYNYSKVR